MRKYVSLAAFLFLSGTGVVVWLLPTLTDWKSPRLHFLSQRRNLAIHIRMERLRRLYPRPTVKACRELGRHSRSGKLGYQIEGVLDQPVPLVTQHHSVEWARLVFRYGKKTLGLVAVSDHRRHGARVEGMLATHVEFLV